MKRIGLLSDTHSYFDARFEDLLEAGNRIKKYEDWKPEMIRIAEKAEKDKLVSEDQRDDIKDQIQELTKKYEARVSEMGKSRQADVLEE